MNWIRLVAKYIFIAFIVNVIINFCIMIYVGAVNMSYWEYYKLVHTTPLYLFLNYFDEPIAIVYFIYKYFKNRKPNEITKV